MDDSLKRAYQQKEEARLEELEATAAKLRARAVKAGAEARIKALEAVDQNSDTARRRLEAIKEAGGDAWEELRGGFEQAVQDLKRSVEKARERIET